jgi:biopolymer transport protein ExbD
MVVRQVVMFYFYFFLGGRGWGEFWSSRVFLGLSLPVWFHITNAAMIVFLVTDFWRFLADRKQKSRVMIPAYVLALIILAGMQYAVLPARSSGQIWWYVPEGDFPVTMRRDDDLAADPDLHHPPPMKLVLRADGNGDVASMRLDEQDFAPADWQALRGHIIGVLGNDPGPDSRRATAEVELDCDDDLRYEHVIDAISAVSGYLTDDDEIVPLVEKIGFSPPKQRAGAGPAMGAPARPPRMPESGVARPAVLPFAEPIVLDLLKSSDVLVYGDCYTMEQMARVMRREFQILRTMGMTLTDVAVVIRADKDCRIGDIQELIRICQDEGFENFVLRVRIRQKP